MKKSDSRILELKDFLDQKVIEYNRPDFIAHDPICIPHRFSLKQDIEIAGLFASVLAWGQRVTIIKKCNELLHYMGDSPHEFLLHHRSNDLKPFTLFKHRTFNGTDAMYFLEFLSHYYKRNDSLESAFRVDPDDETIESGLIRFQKLFSGLDSFPQRTGKHVSTPERKSACKRLNMYLRWMVRQDSTGVDFGLWKNISPAQLVCPCDVHVERVARKLRLMKGKSMNWETALELTCNLRKLDPADPVKYDFALFGLGVLEHF